MKLLKSFKKLKASSLAESVIAIAIISICALVGLTVYLNVMEQNKSTRYYNAKHKVELLTKESIELQSYDNDFLEYNDYTITKTARINKLEQSIVLVFTIKTGNKTYKINKLIPYNEK
ncbi:hypothetical protein D7030_08325 [Flavobacteriaceae bacterium AU392]|nr:hypothetical protein D1817_00090 [Flavobacteriaceae bacterium]RKM85125.1 hypothetical protein D7030_08325 [Flavobacteriaceae bacterium AU392]